MLSRLSSKVSCVGTLKKLAVATTLRTNLGFKKASTFTQEFAARHVVKNESGLNIRQTLFGPNAGPAGCAAGITALCYYGYTLTQKQTGQVGENLSLWPDYVRERLNLTYTYLALSLPVTVVPAMVTARSQLLTKMTHSGSVWMWVLAGAMAVGSGWLTRNLKYEHAIPKHFAWAAHYGVMGAVMAPLCVIGGAPLFRALWYAAGAIAGFAMVGMFAPSDHYMKISGPVGMALGTIMVANLGRLYFPPQAVLSAGMHQAVVAALVLAFSAFILYNNQRVTNMALTMPSHGKPTGENQAKAREDMHMTDRGYDPINAQLSFFMDTFNLGIFMQPGEHF
uniref:Growth hormone-inducible transmembrane protein n=1 Tax=Ditylenchus dipsaci TaxID=166011 RepID=A0A915CZI7_9BILA